MTKKRIEGQTRDSLEYWGGIRPLVRSVGRLPELIKHREGIVNELLAIGYGSVDDILTWDENGKVTVKATRNIPKHVLKAIKRVKVTTDRDGNSTLELEMYDKIAALRVVAKASGLLEKPEDEGDKPSVIGIHMHGPEAVAEYQEVKDDGAEGEV